MLGQSEPAHAVTLHRNANVSRRVWLLSTSPHALLRQHVDGVGVGIDGRDSLQGIGFSKRQDLNLHALLESKEGVRRLAGYMLRHIADKARSDRKGATAHLQFRFDH